MSASFLIQIRSGDTIVHEYRRATSRENADSVRRMAEAGMGWLQAWTSQLTDTRWRDDILLAKQIPVIPGQTTFPC